MSRFFTIGPVQMSARVAHAGGLQPPYFRDEDFAARVIAAQSELLEILGAGPDSEIAVMASSGSGAMEAAVLNFSRRGDSVCVVNGGSFGQQFTDIAQRLGRNAAELKPGPGKPVDLDALHALFKAHRPTCLLINVHETSTGQLFDVPAISRICREFDTLLICDAVSSIGCDPFSMSELGVNVVLFSANKGLALSPGAAFVIADTVAMARRACSESLYFDLGPYFSGAKRGQPPVTSAVSVLMQLFERLNEIRDLGGIGAVVDHTRTLAHGFRAELTGLGFELFAQTPSNAITAFVLQQGTSSELYDYLKTKHDIYINKSAWGLGMDVPRVGHAGAINAEDNAALVRALGDYIKCT